MFCRRKAREGAFGEFVYSEGEYFHDVDEPGCNIRDVRRIACRARPGKRPWRSRSRIAKRGIKGGPMHYPTHSTSGPMCVMNAHAVKVCCWGKPGPDDAYFLGLGFQQ